MSEVQVQAHVLSEDQREVFVGPRPFERSEKNLFFGRDREVDELLSLVTSNRIVLCYAPSGAGKTSLINAGLRPQLETEGFEVLPPTRVRGLIPEGVDESAIPSIYVFNAVLGLARDAASPVELTSQTISGYLATLPHLTDQDNFPSLRILIFDQFEELITSYLERWQEREGFFKQVGDALRADPVLRILFVMREDYLARIEPFMRGLKPLSQSRFRLDLLGPSGAKAAVVGPLRGTQRYFKDGVVDSLIEELLKVRVESTQGDAVEVIGEYVEPVQLQVVCRNLWNSLPADVQEISQEHLKAYGDVDQALRDFYESCIRDAKASHHANDKVLREWFERQLITPAGTRGIVFRDAWHTAGLPNAVVDLLENKHVIRGEWRAGSRWYELTHDRLIEPIQRANERWRTARRKQNQTYLAAAISVVGTILVALISTFSYRTGATQAVPTNATFAAAATSVYENATLAVEAQSTTVAIQSTTVAVQADASLSKSRQLAAEALLANNRNLALLLAIQANSLDDTVEARRSLHKVLSRQSYIDGKFLRDLVSGLITPTLVQRRDDHQGAVVSVAFGPDGQRFVSGSVNGTVLLWDISTTAPISTSLPTSGTGVESVAYSPDGLLVASAGQNPKISLWNAVTGEPERDLLREDDSLVTCLSFSPNGRFLASGDFDSHVFIWDTASGRVAGELKAENVVRSLVWSPDGQVLAVGVFDGSVTFWKNEGQWVQVNGLSGLGHPVRSMAWSPDGKLLAVGLGSDANSPASGNVILWDYENWQRTRTLPDNTTRVRTMAFHPSGKFLAIGWEDGTIVFMDVERWQILGSPLIAHGRSPITSVAFSPDGRYLLSGGLDRTVALWNLSAPTSNLAVSAADNLLATSQGSIISLWNIQDSEAAPSKILSRHTDHILALAFSPNGRVLASSGKDNQVLFWNVDTGKQIGQTRVFSNIRTLQFSPDGATIAVGGDSGRAQITAPVTGQVKYRLIDQEGPPVHQVQFSQDGTTLEVARSDGSLTVFDLRSGEPAVVQESLLPSAQDGITSIALSQDGRWAAYFRTGGQGETAILSNDGRAHGIGLSYWNQSFDPSINPDDIDFVLVKATEGTQYIDPNLDRYVNQIQSIPLRGVYHFFQADQPWREQADFFLANVKDKGFHFYMLFITSPAKGASTVPLSDAERWLQHVDQQVNGRVLVGTSSDFLSDVGSAANVLKEWPLFFSQLPSEPDRNGDPELPRAFTEWRFWNYTNKGKGAAFGTSANEVELIVYNGTPQEMGDWLGLNAFSILDRSSAEVIHPNITVEITGTHSFAFSPDSTYLAAAGNGSVFLLDPATGEEISTLNLGGRTVYSLTFLSDSDHLVIGTDDGTVLVWDLSLLRSAAELDIAISAACSEVQQNFTRAQWTQYYGAEEPYRVTCANAPVP